MRTAAARSPPSCEQCGSLHMERKPAAFAVTRSELDNVQALDPKYRQMVDDEWSKTSYADPMNYLKKMIPFDAADDPGDPIDF